jgi:hypothetical protein
VFRLDSSNQHLRQNTMPSEYGAVHKHSKRAVVSKKPRNNKRRKLELIKRLADTNSFEIKSRVLHAKDNCWKLHDLVYSAEKSRDAIKYRMKMLKGHWKVPGRHLEMLSRRSITPGRTEIKRGSLWLWPIRWKMLVKL